jgi:RNA polymerase-binding transcription factor DksA
MQLDANEACLLKTVKKRRNIKVSMKKFRKKLEKQKTILLERLDNEPNRAIMQRRRSMISRRFNQKLRQMLLFARANQQMKAVDDAIERIDQGVYGQCVACGETIDSNRLEVLPTTTYCWRCQQEKS